MTDYVTPSLLKRHYQEWIDSGVAEEIITRNISSVEDPRECDRLLNRNTKSKWKHSVELAPGWSVSGVDPLTDEMTLKGLQYKPDKAPVDPQTKKPRKYFSPSRVSLAPLFLRMTPNYWEKAIANKHQAIIITEGAKKAGAILTNGYPCISLPGVSTGGKLGRLRPELELFCDYGRPIYLAFDRDIIDKVAVRSALHNLGRMLKEKGCMVYVMEWRNDKKGIDDYLVAGNELEPLIKSAKTLEEWREAWEDEPDSDDIERCRLALRYHMIEDAIGKRLRWNDLKGAIELDHQPTDADEIRLYLALKHNIEVPAKDAEIIVPFLAKKAKYSPVIEYLQECARQYDPDDDLLNSLAKEFLGSDSPLHASYLRKTLIAAVGRAMAPGCKLDTVCILTGGQGVGKSSFWKILASEDWFDDSVGAVGDKDERLKLHQSWLIEWAELETVFRRKDVSAAKAFISTQVDLIRPPYGRIVKEFPRPSIIVGSTNEQEFLADPTGSRRFWVVPVTIAAIPLERLAEERDRIWAAATHAYLSGERWQLSMEERKLAAIENQDYQSSDPWEEVVIDYCTGLTEVTTSQILLDACHVDIENQDKRSQMRVAAILKSNGWGSARRSAHGIKKRFWFPPNVTKEVGQVVPDNTQIQVAVRGQPSDQPSDQPSANLGVKPENSQVQPPDQPDGANLTNLTDHFPKSCTKPGNSLLNSKDDREESIELKRGDKVEVFGGKFTGQRGRLTQIRGDQGFVRFPGWRVDCQFPLTALNLDRTGEPPIVGDVVRLVGGRFGGMLATVESIDVESQTAMVIASRWDSAKSQPLSGLIFVRRLSHAEA